MGLTKIPVGVNYEHYFAGKSILEHILHDLEFSAGYEPKWITCRINQSDTTELSAFFLGWVENEALRGLRMAANKPDPGLFRFMDAVHGNTYERAMNRPTAVLKQDWQRPGTAQFHLEPLRMYLRDGYYHLTEQNEISRLSVAIKVHDRYVGTLNTGLAVDPGKKLDGKMMQWAQGATSELVQYLGNEFVLGGPFAQGGVGPGKTKRKRPKSS